MSLTGVGEIATLVNSVVDKIFPNKTAQETAQLQLLIQEKTQEFALAKAQIDVNNTEASSNSLWVSGGRPFLMWICGCSFAWEFVLQPFISYIFAAFGHPILDLPRLDTGDLNTLLFGMLGLTGARTLEKVKGVARK